jgi:hypothetical protein
LGKSVGRFPSSSRAIDNSGSVKDDSIPALREEVMRIVGAHEGAVHEETYNILNAFLAALPGGTPFNLRKLLLTDKNHADLGLWFAPSSGEPRNIFLRSPALIALETEDQSLYHLNLHLSDVGHALVLGMTGAGKSFLLNCLLTHAQKYQPYTVIFDVGGSYRWITEAMHGSYVSVGGGDLAFSVKGHDGLRLSRQFWFRGGGKHVQVPPRIMKPSILLNQRCVHDGSSSARSACLLGLHRRPRSASVAAGERPRGHL